MITQLSSDDILSSDAQVTLWMAYPDGQPSVALGTYNALVWSVQVASTLSHLTYIRAFDPSEQERELHIASLEENIDTIFSSTKGLLNQGWSPDSLRFVYAQTEQDLDHLYVGDLCGGSVRLLPNIQERQFFESWIDPSRLIVSVGNTDKRDFYLVNIDDDQMFLDSGLESYDLALVSNHSEE